MSKVLPRNANFIAAGIIAVYDEKVSPSRLRGVKGRYVVGGWSKSLVCPSPIYRTCESAAPQNWGFAILACPDGSETFSAEFGLPQGWLSVVSRLLTGVRNSLIFPMVSGLLVVSLANAIRLGYTR